MKFSRLYPGLMCFELMLPPRGVGAFRIGKSFFFIFKVFCGTGYLMCFLTWFKIDKRWFEYDVYGSVLYYYFL